MNLTGTVISVDLNTKAKRQDGVDYPAWQLVFKDGNGEIKDITKHINGLKYTKGLKEGLESLVVGDEFTAVLEKKGAFNEVVAVMKGADVAVSPATKAATTGKVTGSNYETPEEREWNRERIIRQSSISNAINTLKVDGVALNADDVFTLAKRYRDFVNEK